MSTILKIKKVTFLFNYNHFIEADKSCELLSGAEYV